LRRQAHLEKLGHQVFVFTFGAGDYIDDEINIIVTSPCVSGHWLLF
jgi:hypothetical protein